MSDFTEGIYDGALTDELREAFDYFKAVLEDDENGLLEEAAVLLIKLERRAYQLGYENEGTPHPIEIKERILSPGECRKMFGSTKEEFM